jgi:hypothetical protein
MSSRIHPKRSHVRRAALATSAVLALLASWLLDACVYRSETIECDNGVRCPAELVCAESHGVCGPADRVAACTGFLDGASCEIARLPGVCQRGMCELMPCESASDCNDGNLCTDDVCNQGHCENEANTTPCDDGKFCNGPDRCQAEECVPTGVPPCGGNTMCSEELQSCVGCTTDDDCQDDSFSEWSGCQKGSDVCATSGLRSRLEVSWFCNAMQRCELQTGTQTELCTLPAPTGIECDDQDQCTITDQCTATGECTGQPRSCNDGNQCTADACDPGQGCANMAEPFGTRCISPSPEGNGKGNCNGDGDCLDCPSAGDACPLSRPAACEQEEGIWLCYESGDDTCLSQGPKPARTTCRESNGPCDLREVCDGASLECPEDGHVPDKTPCGTGLRCMSGACVPVTP